MQEHYTSEQHVDHLFRHEYGKMVGVLTRIFGFDKHELVEDVIQDAFAKALHTWKFDGIPQNPSAWLMQVAKRRAIDIIRRENRGKEIIIAAGQITNAAAIEPLFHPGEIRDSQLRLIFACCHPRLKEDQQIALTLKTVSGFGIREISKALLISEANVKQRLHRARQKIIDQKIGMEIPAGDDLQPRLGVVLTALYLMFNEGYYATRGESMIRKEVCAEAMRLAYLLDEHEVAVHPGLKALIALMCFQSARFDARADTESNIVLLDSQDRTKWDRDLINIGTRYLHDAMSEGPTTVYHIEAAIAAQHIWAESIEKTDWARLRKLYELLSEVKPGPAVKLNLLVVLIRTGALEEAWQLLECLDAEPALAKNHLLYAVASEFYVAAGDKRRSRSYLETAISLVSNPDERALLTNRLSELE